MAPQGYIASGDAYAHRYDRVIADVLRKTKIVDDTLLWDAKESLETHWWRVLDYPDLCANTGIILNPLKFQVSERCVDFAGFQITESEVNKPLPKYLRLNQRFSLASKDW